MEGVGAKLLGTLRGLDNSVVGLDDTRLTAMAHYLGALYGWVPPRTAIPTLLVRATAPVQELGLSSDGELHASWQLPHREIEVPGNHFSMMTEHAESTASAVENALSIDSIVTVKG